MPKPATNGVEIVVNGDKTTPSSTKDTSKNN